MRRSILPVALPLRHACILPGAFIHHVVADQSILPVLSPVVPVRATNACAAFVAWLALGVDIFACAPVNQSVAAGALQRIKGRPPVPNAGALADLDAGVCW